MPNSTPELVCRHCNAKLSMPDGGYLYVVKESESARKAATQTVRIVCPGCNKPNLFEVPR